MKKIVLFILLILVGANLSFAQQRVTGRVTSKDDGQPVAFATVAVKGFTAVTATNDNGEYTINVPDGGTTLIVSFMGMVDQEASIGGRSIVNVELESEGGVMLAETVVTAMGIKRERKALGYTVSDISSDELMKNKQTNVINSLAGKIPGVNITQSSGAAGAGSSITIRGGNSASESRDNQPLFVVDGIIFDNTTSNTGNSGTDGMTKSATTFSNRVMDINPEDIESMSVLKGAAAAALYGSRAADGVVIITTKKGSEGALRVNYSGKYTRSWVNKLPDQQSIYGRGIYNEAGVFNDFTPELYSWGQPITGTAYNNVEDFFQVSNIYDNSVSVSGGTQNGTFYLSASNYDQEGVVPGTNYRKNTFRLNAEQKYGIVTVGANASYSQANSKKTLTSTGLYGQGGTQGSSGAMSSLYIWPRSDDMSRWLNDDGTKYRMFEGKQDMDADIENPYWIINKNSIKDATYRFNGGSNVNIKLADWWDITGRAGIDRYNLDSYTYQAPGGALKTMYQNGTLSKGDITFQYLTAQFLSNMQKSFGDFDFGLLLGASTEDTKRINQSHWGYDFLSEGTISFKNISTDKQYFSDATVRKRLVGVFGEFRASYKNIAYLTVTGRNDWSSTLPIDNRSYFYPSISGSFVFTELLPKNSILSFGKVRGSWARVGKDADPYSLNTYLWPVATLNGGVYGVGDQWTGGSPNLKPEIQDSWEVGLEMRFLNGRLGFDYTYYSKKTKNQICAPRLGQSTGYIFLTLNGGSVEGEGMELAITGKPIVTRDFQWEASLNLSGNRTRLGDFVDGVSIFYVTDAQQGGAKAGSVPNGGYFYGLTGDHFLTAEDGNGVERNIIDPTTGLFQRTNVETNVLANREPKMIGGLNNSFTYKNLNLSFLWDVRVGGAVYNGTERTLMLRGLSKNTENRESVTFTGVVKNGSAYEEKTITYEANQMYTVNGRQRSGYYMIQQYYMNEARNANNFITDTNWLRLRSISVSYNFKDLLKNQKVIKGLTATLSGNNLILITNYKGMDPEVTSAGSGTGGSGSMGIDYLGVPATAGVSFGVNVTF